MAHFYTGQRRVLWITKVRRIDHQLGVFAVDLAEHNDKVGVRGRGLSQVSGGKIPGLRVELGATVAPFVQR